LTLLGIGTHLASPDSDPEYTRWQIESFLSFVAAARARGIRLPNLHVASSGALLRYPEAHLDMVRLGGLLYGMPPSAAPEGLQPVLSLYTQIVYLRDLPAGVRVGYGSSFSTKRSTRLATLPVGYHDGYLHHLSNRAQVLIRGQRAPVVGRVTMDYIMVDVTEISGASVGDCVTLLGQDGEHSISAADLAAWAGTIPYEIPSHLGPRVVRRYHGTATTPGAPRFAVGTDGPPERLSLRVRS
ncbi:MAG: alanine racemase, partial [Planctomycetota bacterium]